MSVPRLEQPIIVLGCNRSGTTLLFNNLSAHPDTWSLYIESQDIFYRHHPIHPDWATASPSRPVTRSARTSSVTSTGPRTTRSSSRTRRDSG